MPLQCRLELTKPENGVTYDGCDIAGTIHIVIRNPIKLSALTVGVKGKGFCHFRESTASHKVKKRDMKFQGREVYVTGSTDLIKPPMGESKLKLAPGTYTFPFNIFIPLGVPSSFDYPGGKIWYKVQVRFWRPLKRNITFDRNFNVYSHLDLNLDPELGKPVDISHKKKFYNFVVKSGEMWMELQTSATGFVPGQAIPLHVRFTNYSSVEVTAVEASLNQHIMYRADGGRKKRFSAIRIEKVCVDKVNNDKSVLDMELAVPATAQTSLLNAKIISVKYDVQVKIRVVGLHMNPVMRIPVVIGTEPIRTYDQPGTSALHVPTFAGPPILPPSYEEATKERFDSSDDESAS